MTDDNINLHIAISSRKPHQARLFAYVAHMLATGDNVSVWARNAMIAAIPKDYASAPTVLEPLLGNSNFVKITRPTDSIAKSSPVEDETLNSSIEWHKRQYMSDADELSYEEID